MKPRNVMKSKNVVIAFIFLLIGSVSVELEAQETIKALLKKCESMDSITVSVIREKDKETGKIIRDFTTVSFKSGSLPALEKELIAAFQKDEDKADRVSKSISSGKVTSMLFRFGETTYNYTYIKSTGRVSVTVNTGTGVTVTRVGTISNSIPINNQFSELLIQEEEVVEALRRKIAD